MCVEKKKIQMPLVVFLENPFAVLSISASKAQLGKKPSRVQSKGFTELVIMTRSPKELSFHEASCITMPVSLSGEPFGRQL